MNSEEIAMAAQALVERAEHHTRSHQARIYEETDRMFGWLMLGQWAFAIALAFVVSPYAWEGKVKSLGSHLPAAVILGAVLNSLPVYLAFRRRGWVGTRHLIAVSQMMWSALLIHLTGGRIETHFHVFGSLAFIAFYRDWKVIVTAAATIAIEHFVRGIYWPESVYGIVNPAWWRFLEHGAWVVFCSVFLIQSCRKGTDEIREMSEQWAQLEAALSAKTES